MVGVPAVWESIRNLITKAIFNGCYVHFGYCAARQVPSFCRKWEPLPEVDCVLHWLCYYQLRYTWQSCGIYAILPPGLTRYEPVGLPVPSNEIIRRSGCWVPREQHKEEFAFVDFQFSMASTNIAALSTISPHIPVSAAQSKITQEFTVYYHSMMFYHCQNQWWGEMRSTVTFVP